MKTKRNVFRSQEKADERAYHAEKSVVRENMSATKKSEGTALAKNPIHLIKAAEISGIKKEPIQLTNWYKVTFRLPGEAAKDAKKVTIVGDFNAWDSKATPLKKAENGDFEVKLKLVMGREYKFRYLIDDERWENDWHADKYVKSPYGAEDSVVCV